MGFPLERGSVEVECAPFMRRMMPSSVLPSNIVLEFGASPQKRNPEQGRLGLFELPQRP
jgi:hypothetical protein